MPPGVRGELELDIARALRGINQIEGALGRATSQFGVALARAIDAVSGSQIEVDADATQVTGSIDAAVENADTGVEVTGEAGEVTGSIEGAIDAADTGIEVTGDASQVTGAITGAVDAADTHVEITGDASKLKDEVEDTTKSLDTAGGSAGVLGTRIGGAFGQTKNLATAAKGFVGFKIFQTAVDSASDLNESLSKVRVTFGDGADDIEAFASTSATSMGLAEGATLEFAGTFGNLLQALGVARDEATRLSPKILTLGADLASFNNLGVDETLEKIRSGLIGEVEPLRSLGVSFNAAQVEAEAFRVAAEGGRTEITEGDKVLARYRLIVQQTGLAQGDFARTADGLANSQRIANAQLQNAVAALGEQLAPIVSETVIPAITGLADVLSLVIDILPEGSAGLLALAAAGAAVAGPFGALAGAAVGAFASFREGRESVKRLRDAIEEGKVSFEDLPPILQDMIGPVEDLNLAASKGDPLMTRFADSVDGVTVSADAAAIALEDYQSALDKVIGTALSAAEAQIRSRESVRRFAEEMEKGRQKGETLAEVQDRVGSSALDVVDGVQAEIDALVASGEVQDTATARHGAFLSKLREIEAQNPALREALQGIGIDLDALDREVVSTVGLTGDQGVSRTLDDLLRKAERFRDPILVRFGQVGSVPGAAHGGVFDRPFIAGEAGTELIVPTGSVEVIPHAQTLSILDKLGGNTSISVTVALPEWTRSRSEADDLGRIAGRRVASEIVAAVRGS